MQDSMKIFFHIKKMYNKFILKDIIFSFLNYFNNLSLFNEYLALLTKFMYLFIISTLVSF